MKLVVFGATGGTGQQVMEQALAHGHEVTAIARSPNAIAFTAPRLSVVQGDILQRDSVERAVAGHDAVISAVGTHSGRTPTTLYSAGITNLLHAMQKHGLRRLVAVTAAGYLHNPRDGFLLRSIVRPLISYLFAESYADMQRMEALLQASTIDWTIVRPTRLLDGKRTGSYRCVSQEGVPNGWSINRADVADYILTHLNDPASIHAAVALAY